MGYWHNVKPLFSIKKKKKQKKLLKCLPCRVYIDPFIPEFLKWIIPFLDVSIAGYWSVRVRELSHLDLQLPSVSGFVHWNGWQGSRREKTLAQLFLWNCTNILPYIKSAFTMRLTMCEKGTISLHVRAVWAKSEHIFLKVYCQMQ